MGDVNHNPGCECLSCHVARERMLHRICEHEVDPIPPSGEIGRQLAEVTKRANEAWIDVHKSGPRREMYIFGIDPALGPDETTVHGFVTIERYEEVIAAKDARIAELLAHRVETLEVELAGSEDRNKILLKHYNKVLSERDAARNASTFVDPDEKPKHNPFREFTKDRRMMGP